MGSQPNQNKQVTGNTTVAGKSSAAEVNLDERELLEVFYDIAAASDDIILEVSEDNSTWRQLDTVAASAISTGGEAAFMGPYDTTYTYARAYPGAGFADADVNVVEVSCK